MSKGQGKQQGGRRGGWRWVVAGGVVLVGVAAFWWPLGAQKPSGGTPRLVVDRTEIDLGYFPYDKRAKAVFTLTNAGDAPLRILEVPPVKALKGC
jgi:hypothetical protein